MKLQCDRKKWCVFGKIFDKSGMQLRIPALKWPTWAFWEVEKTHLSGPVTEKENIREDPSAPKAQKFGNLKVTIVGRDMRDFSQNSLKWPTHLKKLTSG